ncbi:hypothetical protein ABLT09_26080, partial [Pseudomonas aeruginosa]
QGLQAWFRSTLSVETDAFPARDGTTDAISNLARSLPTHFVCHAQEKFCISVKGFLKKRRYVVKRTEPRFHGVNKLLR